MGCCTPLFRTVTDVLQAYTHAMRNAHLTGDLGLIAGEIGEWARRRESIVRLWLYGSRVRSTHSPESDLDIAFELDALPAVTTTQPSHAELTDWTADLSSTVGLEVHLESIAAASTQDAVTDHGVLIYEREGAQPCRWLA
jgi:Predicted nucleotidyltransferases